MTISLTQHQIKKFQNHILAWYNVHKRDLPWRVPYGTRFQPVDPYKILVSEVMSQQTQISRVVPKYEAWIKTFPTIQSLAKAPVRDVLGMWSGLGYNRRALYLKKCAEIISSSARNPNGISHSVRDDNYWVWPRTEKELIQLPGIGKYTARALLCFAFNQQVAVVDTNIKKVILTQVVHQDTLPEKGIEEIAVQLLPKGKAYAWNQALMDYAAAELKQHKIIIAKQSRFKDSDRFYRGQIIKWLVEKGSGSRVILFTLLSKKYGLTEERFGKIVASLITDKLVVQKNKQLLTLP
jgi:A/G-specific adenine glycosylase